MSHVTHTNEACHRYEWDMSHVWARMSNVTHGMRMITNVWTFVSHVTEWAMSHMRMPCVTYLIRAHTCDMPHSMSHMACAWSRMCGHTFE